MWTELQQASYKQISSHWKYFDVYSQAGQQYSTLSFSTMKLSRKTIHLIDLLQKINLILMS